MAEDSVCLFESCCGTPKEPRHDPHLEVEVDECLEGYDFASGEFIFRFRADHPQSLVLQFRALWTLQQLRQCQRFCMMKIVLALYSQLITKHYGTITLKTSAGSGHCK